MSVILETSLASKYEEVKKIIFDMGEVVIAMSGGVDSVLLAKIAYDVLKDDALAVTADSPSLPRRELEETRRITKLIGIKHRIITTNEIHDPRYSANPFERCYFCKSELFEQLDIIKRETNVKWIIFGENIDDQSDHRPGNKAAREHFVRGPLREANLSKKEIRTLAKSLELPIWDKPASACLASRIPYGEEVTEGKLKQIEESENYLWDLGFRGLRVRHHGEIARIEVSPEQMHHIIEIANDIYINITQFGFKYVTLDLGGYRRGSLNEGFGLIPLEKVGSSS